MSHKKTFSLIVIAILLVAAFVPYKTTIVTRWEVVVHDSAGQPCRNQRVTESWNYESLFILSDLPHGREEQKLTDDNGSVSFDERTIRASMMWRIAGNILGVLGIFIHNPGGPPEGYIYATGMTNAEHGFGISFHPGRPMPYEITVDECFDSSKEFMRTL